jgi:1-aminocyclopropane-1-carboxylate deaminase/D-cysteine desulfhydrase-like pyridoxal-dependent ACC family enzyme
MPPAIRLPDPLALGGARGHGPDRQPGGPGYGAVTPEGWEAADLLARTEGVLLDPVYTAKAMACLIADVRERRVASGETVVFIHTGGLPAVFAYRDELMAQKKRYHG